MRGMFSRLRMKLSRCYGNDELNKFLMIISVVLALMSLLLYLHFLIIPALILSGYTTYRAFSTNIYKRRAELDKFLARKAKRQKKKNMKKLIRREKKDFLYFKCPKCKEYLRVPRGKGQIVVTCRVCGEKIDKKS